MLEDFAQEESRWAHMSGHRKHTCTGRAQNTACCGNKGRCEQCQHLALVCGLVKGRDGRKALGRGWPAYAALLLLGARMPRPLREAWPSVQMARTGTQNGCRLRRQLGRGMYDTWSCGAAWTASLHCLQAFKIRCSQALARKRGPQRSMRCACRSPGRLIQDHQAKVPAGKVQGGQAAATFNLEASGTCQEASA